MVYNEFMKKLTSAQEELITKLKAQIKKLEAEITKVDKATGKTESVAVTVKLAKSQARFERIKKQNERDEGIGEFFMQVDVTAGEKAVFVPLSIASSRKPTGFIYQIEGTGKGDIATADVTSRGAGVTQITLGTILYTRIPAGKTGSFRILVEIRGHVHKEYRVTITRMNYKFDPSDSRYQRYEKAFSSKMVRFD